MRSRNRGLSVPRALALGAIQGPCELLPISSSAHLEILPALMGWEWEELDGQVRKLFAVALHAGTAAALVISSHDQLKDARRGPQVRDLALIGISSAPPALAGYALKRPIEQRLGSPPTLVPGLLAGAIALTLSERAPALRRRDQAGPLDALWLGVAQACALVPGISRHGAAIATARLLRFRREDAIWLSRHAGLPVIAGAALLEGAQLARGAPLPGAHRWLAAGTGAAFVSALLCAGPLARLERDQSLLPFGVYRFLLAVALLWHHRRSQGSRLRIRPPRGYRTIST